MPLRSGFVCWVSILFFGGIGGLGIPTRALAHSPHDHIEAFELGPGSEGTGTVMLIVVRGNLWRSTDGGQNWKRIVRGLDNRHEIVEIAYEVLGDETLWYLRTRNDGVVYRSGDDGLSWRRAEGSVAFPGDGREIDFEPTGEGLTDKRVTSVLKRSDSELFVSTWNDGVFFSGDGGKSWERRARGLTTDPQGDRRGLPQFTTLRAADGGVLFLAGYDGFFRSGNDGRDWREVETLPETLLIDFDVSPNHRQDGELVATTYWKGAFHSKDRGKTWSPINGNVGPSAWDHLKRKLKGDGEYTQVARFHSIAFSPDYANDGTLFAGLRNWFLISENSGKRWDRIELTQFADGEDVVPDRVVFSDGFAEDETLFFCARLGEGKTRRGSVFRSTDGGRSFELVHEAEGKYMQSLAISPGFSEDGIILVCSARGANNSEVFRSADRGETWETVTGELEFVDFGAELAFVSREVIWAGTEKGLWISVSNGTTWDRLDTGKFSEDGFVDMVGTWPLKSLGERTSTMPIVVVFKGEGAGIWGEEFTEFHPELFAENHQFNRLWSYSPGRMVKFVTGDSAEWNGEFYGMTGESLLRIEGDSVEELPIRVLAEQQGEVNLTAFWIGMAAIGGAVILALGRVFRRQRSG